MDASQVVTDINTLVFKSDLFKHDNLITDKGNVTLITKITLVTSTAAIVSAAVAVLLLIFTACLFKEWRRSYKNQLLIQLILIRFTYTLLRYLHDILKFYANKDQLGGVVYLDKYLMIYTELTLILFMLIFTRHMYEKLVKVFDKRRSIWKVSLGTRIVSCLTSIVVYLLFGWGSNGVTFKIFFLYLGVLKWPLLLGNAVMLFVIMKTVIKSNRIVQHRRNLRPVCVISLLMFTLCFNQMFVDIYKLVHFFYKLPSVTLIISNTLTVFQCTFSVIFWIFGNKNTCLLWKNQYRKICFCCSASN